MRLMNEGAAEAQARAELTEEDSGGPLIDKPSSTKDHNFKSHSKDMICFHDDSQLCN